MTYANFEEFRDHKLHEGYDDVLLREWTPGFSNEVHTHPFDTYAIVATGEFWLTVDGQTLHYRAGEAFQLARNVPHSERYGSEGAVFWAARRNP
jgi:Cupin domain